MLAAPSFFIMVNAAAMTALWNVVRGRKIDRWDPARAPASLGDRQSEREQLSTRRLPNLLIVGIPKAGTTSLFAYLAQHRDICGCTVKEPGYFDQFSPRRPANKVPMTIEQYQELFSACGAAQYAMEATPSYCYGGQPTIDAIRSSLPNPRIIISLRNPTDRLWSAYTFQRSQGNLPGIRSFAEYLAVCEQRHVDGTDRVATDHLQGLATGFYAEYVPLWVRAFGDHARVIFAEELASQPLAVLHGLCAWLGIDLPGPETFDLEAKNVTVHARSPHLARTVYRLKRAGDRRRMLPGPLRERLRRVYLRFNAGGSAGSLPDGMRRRVDGIYEESNREMLRVLNQYGYDRFPSWLEGRSVAQSRSS